MTVYKARAASSTHVNMEFERKEVHSDFRPRYMTIFTVVHTILP
jgi:hypothetical protein